MTGTQKPPPLTPAHKRVSCGCSKALHDQCGNLSPKTLSPISCQVSSSTLSLIYFPRIVRAWRKRFFTSAVHSRGMHNEVTSQREKRPLSPWAMGFQPRDMHCMALGLKNKVVTVWGMSSGLVALSQDISFPLCRVPAQPSEWFPGCVATR